MKNHTLRAFAVSASLVSAIFAQNNQRQATIVGGGSPDRGKCTLEVVVDGVAQVEIRGATATLRTVSGQPAQWRRFECSSAMPVSPANFRFSGVDGRGRQDLTRDPREGGVAVVQIEDRNGGAEAYTFDINWDARGDVRGPNAGGNYPNNNGPVNGGYPQNSPDRGYANSGRGPGNGPAYDDPNRDRYRAADQYRPNYRDSDYYRRYGHGFGTDEAVRVCQQAIVNQASRRFRNNEIHFQRTSIDDNPGRNDWVIGTVDVHRGPREERYGFSCSVDFGSGRVRSAELDPRPLQGDGFRR